jgi:uncharacterized protein (TIGR02099 family)
MFRAALALLAMLSVAGVLLASLAFLVLQNLDQYRDELAVGVGEMLEQPVEIGAAEVLWQGWRPILRLEDLTIGGDSNTSVRFEAAELRIDPVESLSRRTLATAGVRILGATIEIARNPGGNFKLLGLGTAKKDKPFDVRIARRLLSGPARLTLANARLIYHDKRRAKGSVELTIDVGVHRGPDGQRLSGAIRLPGRSQSYVTAEGTFALPPTGSGWVADVRLRSTGLVGSDLQDLIPELKLPDGDAVARFDVRARMSERRHLSMNGRIGLTGLRWSKSSVGPSAISARVQMNLSQPGWRVELTDINVDNPQGRWSAARGSLAYQYANADSEARYSATLTEGHIEDLLAMAGFLAPQKSDVDALAEFAPVGRALDVTAAWVDRTGSDTPFDLTARLSDVAWPSGIKVWGASGIGGDVRLTHEGGRLRLSGDSEITVLPVTLTAKPLHFDSAHGTVAIKPKSGRVELSTEAITLRGPITDLLVSGAVSLSDTDPPEFEVDIEANQTALTKFKGLLPSPVLSAGLNTWLVDAIDGGVAQRTAIHLSSVTKGATPIGIHLEFDLDEMNINYAPGWPAGEGVKGSLVLDSDKLNFDGAVKSVGGLPAKLSITIPDVNADDPELNIGANLTGKTNRLVTLLAATPLFDTTSAKQLKSVSVAGRVKARLNLRRNIGSGKQTLKAKLELKDNSLAAINGLPALDKIRGTVAFDTGTLSSKGLAVRVNGQATTLSGKVDLTAGPAGSLELRTRAPHQFWVDLLRETAGDQRKIPDWVAQLEGRATWVAEVKLAKGAPPLVGLRSDLRGIAINLPAPFNKAEDDSVMFRISKPASDDGPLYVEYGDRMRGQYRSTAGKPDEFDLALRLGEGTLPKFTPGKWIVRGTLGRFDTSTLMLADDAQMPDLSKLDLDVMVGILDLAGAHFKRVRVAARGTTDTSDAPIRFELDSENLVGVLDVPHTKDAPLGVALERLNISSLPDAPSPDDVDPRRLPAMSFSVKSVRFEERDLGTLKFVAHKSPSGVVIDKLYLIGDDIDAQGAASWSLEDGQHRTNVQATVNTNTLGALFKEAGQPGNFAQGGATRITFEAGWNVPPFALSLDNMTGALEFHAGAGRFQDVDTSRGAQLIGLFNLRILPRILTFDMSSFFKKGLGFDNIFGRFQIESGQAYTNDLTLDSPTARISFAGRTGIVGQDYDQIVTITPKLTDSLPVAGAAFGVVGAGVGGAIWLVEKVIGADVVDRVAAFQYKLTGKWADPTFERIVVAAPENSGKD